ncbi:Putative nucleoside transporter YegT [Planctomycetes bacterium MalM25]|nr:Putative nucleoside transporter YegT [Planctomycetes bacterium MalM25]
MPTPPPTDATPRSSGAMLARLSVMMLLQYWPLGLWFVTVKTFIAANTEQEGEALFSAGFIGYSGMAAAFGSLVAPTLMGWIADRFFSAEKLVALLNLAAALALTGMYHAGSQTTFFLCLILYFQAFCPSVSLTNTIAFSKLSDRDREFPVVRLYGTVAWIAAGVFVGVICRWWFGENIEPTRTPMTIAIGSHLAMALYSLTLPRTEPQRVPVPGKGSGWALLRDPVLAMFLLVSLLAATGSQAYDLNNVYLNQRGYEGAAATLTLGQLTEVACLAAMPWLHRRWRLKTLFLVGVLCWSFRYLLLAMSSVGEPTGLSAAMIYSAILVHGPAYVFVYLAGQMYVDRLTDPANRGVAQGFHALATVGLGHVIGSGMTGWSQATFLTPAGVSPPPYDWTPYWMIPVATTLGTAILFAFAFSGGPKPGASDTDPADDSAA